MCNIYWGKPWILYCTEKQLRPQENKLFSQGYSGKNKTKSKCHCFSAVFSLLIFQFYILNFRDAVWTGDTPFCHSFQVLVCWYVPFLRFRFYHKALCFGSTNCHFNATYWSCRQPASHKSCKVPGNMIYELSYGKWGPLIFLTLQNVVPYHSLLSWLNWSCVWMLSLHIAPASTPT